MCVGLWECVVWRIGVILWYWYVCIRVCVFWERYVLGCGDVGLVYGSSVLGGSCGLGESCGLR